MGLFTMSTSSYEPQTTGSLPVGKIVFDSKSEREAMREVIA